MTAAHFRSSSVVRSGTQDAGAATTVIDLRGLSKPRLTLKLTVLLRNGQRRTITRVYRRCTKRGR